MREVHSAVAKLHHGMLALLAVVLMTWGIAVGSTPRQPGPRPATGLAVAVWPTRVSTLSTAAERLSLYVAVVNESTSPIAVHDYLLIQGDGAGVAGLLFSATDQAGRELVPAVARKKVVFRKEDFMWLPSHHLYGLQVRIADVFPQLRKRGQYRISVTYANPFHVQPTHGRPGISTWAGG